jgi:hypothetical protein
MSGFTRRQLPALSLAAAGWRAVAAKEAALLEPVRTISQQPDVYHGWPTLAQRANGDLFLAWSGGREGHVCPFGRVELMVSRDDGRTWSWPRTVIDSDLDDRDAGIVETRRGSLLLTTFTSLAYEPVLEKQRGNWPAEKRARWEAAQQRLGPEQRKAELGMWMIRSTDGGIHWSAPFRVPLNSPHGPVALSDGRTLYAGKVLYGGDGEIGVCESKDDGATWHWLARIPARPGDQGRDYHELHMVEAAPGKLIAHVRNHNAANERETLQSESRDGGKTWTTPHAIGVWGLPSHLLRLRDGRLLMTYGHRRQPFGNQARVSADGGQSWSDPIVISADGVTQDLGYPSTVELRDGSLLSIWYELRPNSTKAVLRQARWKL